MKKVILNLAVSLDGFIARDDGRVDWLDNLDTDGSDLGISSFLENVSTILTGRISFDDTKKLTNGSWPFVDQDTYVFSRGNYENEKGITFVNGDIEGLIEKLRIQSEKDIWLFGGGGLIKYCREHNLVDEYVITTIPTMIGSGKRLFHSVKESNDLELINLTECKSIVQTHYRVKK